MSFRISFQISYILFIINIGNVLSIPAANLIEKGVFLLSAVIFIMTRMVDKFIIIITAFLIVIIFILSSLSSYPDFEWFIFINALNQIVIIFALLAGFPTEKDRDAILRTAAWLPAGSVMLGACYQVVGLREMFGQEFSTGIYRYQASLIPAYLSGLAMCGAFAALQIALAKRSVYMWLALFNLIILLAAGGRAALVVALVTCGASLLLKKDVPSSRKILFGLSGLALFLMILTLFWERVATRFTSSGANGRDLMWQYLLELAEQYPWTGIGFGHQYFAVPRDVYILVGSAAAHNDYVRLIVEMGYVGMIAFYVLFSAVILRILTRKWMRADLTILVAFAGFLLMSRTDNALASPSYFPIVFLAALSSIAYPKKLIQAGGPMPAPSLAINMHSKMSRRHRLRAGANL